MADMAYITLRSKIQSKCMIQVWFEFFVVISEFFEDDLFIMNRIGSFGMTIEDCNMKIRRKSRQSEDRKRKGRRPVH